MLTLVVSAGYFYYVNREDDRASKKPQKKILFEDIVGLEEPKVALQEVI